MQCLPYVSGAPDQRGSWYEAVDISPWLCWPYIDPVEAVPGLVLLGRKMSCILQSFFSLTNSTDKKNENKEVAVNDFLGAESAVEAIGHSM
jgi:hypothetical protein